jgi:CRISPR-associated protein Csm5
MVAKGGGKFELGWKASKSTVPGPKINDSTPHFAEMASAGTIFEGFWREKTGSDRAKLFEASNRHTTKLIALHKHYAELLGLTELHSAMASLEKKTLESMDRPNSCVFSIGWGAGLLGKTGYLATEDESYRKIMRQTAMYQRAIQTGMPFPKTRRIVFQGSKPATLPGYILFEVLEP